MKKGLSLSLIIALVLSIVVIPIRTSAEEAKEEINPTIICEWRDNNKTLVIKGKGRLPERWMDKVEKWHLTFNKLIIEEGISSISPMAFNDIGKYIESIKFPEGLKVLEEYTLLNCDRLKKVEFPSSLVKIESEAFYFCNALTSLKIPDSVTSIGKNAFSRCSYLKKLVLPKSLKTYENAFEYCPSLKTVVNRSSLSIPLDNCKKRKTWYVNGKKKSKVSAGKTAKAKGKEYKIKYDLRGGKAKCKLPKTYRYGSDLKLPMKKITKKGYYFLAWKVYKNSDTLFPYDFSMGPSTSGTAKVNPIWVKYTVKNVKGRKIKISVENHKKLAASGFVTRYSTKKDMSNAKYCPSDGFGNDLKWGNKVSKYTLKGLKKGKKYYIEIAARYSEDIGPWCGKRCVKVKK